MAGAIAVPGALAGSRIAGSFSCEDDTASGALDFVSTSEGRVASCTLNRSQRRNLIPSCRASPADNPARAQKRLYIQAFGNGITFAAAPCRRRGSNSSIAVHAQHAAANRRTTVSSGPSHGKKLAVLWGFPAPSLLLPFAGPLGRTQSELAPPADS